MKRNVLNMLKRCAALVVAAAAVIPASAYAMNGMAPIGYGVKSQGMGGVGVALPQDSFAAAHNPAGMWMLCSRWDVGLSYVAQKVRAQTVAFNGTQLQSVKSNRGLWFPEIGVNWNFCRTQSVGLAFLTQGAMATRYNQPLRDLGIGSNSRFWAYQWTIMPSWSWQINCVHSVGVAVNFLVSALRADGLQELTLAGTTGGNFSIYPGFVTNKGTNVATGASVRIGWIGQFTRCFRVGATWQTKAWQQKFKKYEGFLANSGELSWPYYLAVGFAYQIMPCLTFAFDYGLYFWGGRRQFGDTLNGQGLIGSTNASRFGGRSGPGFGWNDQSVVKLGLAWDVVRCWTLRLGYNYGTNPINVTETYLNRLTAQSVTNHITVGTTWKSCCGELSAFYWYGFKRCVRGRDSSPDFTGTAITNNYNVRNQQNAVGLSWGGHF